LSPLISTIAKTVRNKTMYVIAASMSLSLTVDFLDKPARKNTQAEITKNIT